MSISCVVTASLIIGIFEDIGTYLTAILTNIEKRVKAIANNTIIHPKNNSQDYLSNIYFVTWLSKFLTFIFVFNLIIRFRSTTFGSI